MGLLSKFFGGGSRGSAGVWRQGDVFLVPVSTIPAGSVPVRKVLAEGEATGHAHVLEPEAPANVLRSTDGGLFVDVHGASAVIRHEEHGPITLPTGQYVVRIQREYHPKEIRRVID